MVTVAIIAMPFLGNSVIRGLQRILGGEALAAQWARARTWLRVCERACARV